MDLDDEIDSIKVEISDDDDSNNNKNIVCGDCGRNIKNEKCLQGHMKQYHEKVICPTCGIECLGWKRYHSHKRQHESQPCNKCNKEFSPDHIKRHMRSCKGIPKPKYSCEKCDFSANVKKELQRFVNLALKLEQALLSSSGSSLNSFLAQKMQHCKS